MLTKICTKCGLELEANTDNFYRHSIGKYGLNSRCKSCINEDNKLNHQKRMLKNPDLVKAQDSARTKKSYYLNHEKNKEKQREYQKKYRDDLEKYKKIQARKRGGGAKLSFEEIEQIKINQNNKCAICFEDNPTDLDHCHKTGKVRFLLCKHCNRGLGAFKDNPVLLRQAALLMEQQNDN